MRYVFAPSLLALAAACGPNVVAQTELAPMSLQSARAPAQVVNAAAQNLTAQGFDIVTSDATGGLLTARRTQTPERWGALVTCGFKPGTGAHQFGEGTYTVTVAATPAAQGSAVTIRGRVRMSYRNIPGIPPAMTLPDSDNDCVSTGTVERQLADALR